MNRFRQTTCFTAILLFGFFGALEARADARANALENARQHIKQPEPLLSSVFVVVIGYEGNLELFKKGTIPPPQNGTGLAIPVDADGYFLTAAHSVQPAHDMYVMGNFEGRLEARKAEIIFRGDPGTALQDIALLRVAAKLPVCFEFTNALPKSGDTIYAVVRSQDKPAFIEGKCLTPSASYDARSTVAIMTDLPVVGGDSGGPLLTKELKLIGVTSRGATNGWGTFTYSSCPSGEFVERLIKEAKEKSNNLSSVPKSGSASVPGSTP
ncbi:MAG: serine protease [Nibricoccus sp.]